LETQSKLLETQSKLSGEGLHSEDHSLAAIVKLYYDLYVPASSNTTAPAPLLIALHGYGANKRQMMREARLLAPSDFALVSLQGFHQHMKEPKETGGPLRYGFGWVTNFHPEESIAMHHRALIDLINSLVSESVVDRERVFLLGFSQSCALNYRFAFTHPEYLRGVIGICGGLPGDWETSELYRRSPSSILHLAGGRDEFYPPARISDYAAQLRARAGEVEMRSYDGAHEIVPAMREDVREWLHEHAAR
jgi:phospholipase/carboxylesterase